MSDSLESLVDDLIDNAPKVNEEIVSKLQEVNTHETVEQNPEPSGDTDTVPLPFPPGTSQPNVGQDIFNPAIHETNADGTPRKTKEGRYRRKRGPKSGNQIPPASTVPVQDKPEISVTADYSGTAQFLCGLMFSSCETLFGPVWKPSDGERKQTEIAAEAYCRSQQLTDIPPGIALVLCVSLYAIPRVNDPETKRRFRVIGESMGFVKPPVQRVTNQTPQNTQQQPQQETYVRPTPMGERFSTIYDNGSARA